MPNSAVFVILASVAVGLVAAQPTVKTTSGSLIGRETIILGHRVDVFLGVPYAVPPIGDLRFKAPLPIVDEEAFLETQNFGPICFQPPHATSALNPLLKPNQANISEDCLYLNLYVPEKSQEEEFPVMVWLSGEGFSYSDPNQFDGSILAATQKLIVVTVNYRVSIFGFFNGLSEEAPGNAGLWDQRLALKWVKNNIRAFGGDPDKVTLSGRFSGAMSTVIQTFSPLSKEEILFKRIILHSGVPDGKWIFNRNPLSSATALAHITECSSSNLTIQIACIKRLPADVLLNAALSMQSEWKPSLDFNLINKSTLSELTKENYTSVDVLIGTNNNEGSLCLTALKVINSTRFELLIDDKLPEDEFEQLITSFMLDIYKESNELVEHFVHFTYAIHENSRQKEKFVKFCGDAYIKSLSQKLANLISAKQGNIYVYELTHRPSFSNQPAFIKAGHGDDVIYAFGLPLEVKNLKENEEKLTKNIMKSVANFVYYGNPNDVGETHWPVYNNETKLVKRFDVNPETEDIVKSSYENAAVFWRSIIPEALANFCSLEPMTAALIDNDNKTENSETASFLGIWVSIPVAEYIIVGLLFSTGLLLLSVLLALIVIYRQTTSMSFQRLK